MKHLELFENFSSRPEWDNLVKSLEKTTPNVIQENGGQSLHWGAPDHDKYGKELQWPFGFSVNYPKLEYIFSSDLNHDTVKKKFDDVAAKYSVDKLLVKDGAWKSSGKAPEDIRNFIIDVLNITGFPYK